MDEWMEEHPHKEKGEGDMGEQEGEIVEQSPKPWCLSSSNMVGSS